MMNLFNLGFIVGYLSGILLLVSYSWSISVKCPRCNISYPIKNYCSNCGFKRVNHK